MRLSLEKTKAFWLYIAIGIIALALGVMLLPVWARFEQLFFSDWGEIAIKIMMSAALVAYIFLYLVKRIKRYAGTPAQVIAIVELVLMVVIAVVCAVSTFPDIISFGDPCRILGLVLWARGASDVFTGYYCDSYLVNERIKRERNIKSGKVIVPADNVVPNEEPSGGIDDFSLWRLSLAVLLISVGTYIFIDPPLKQIVFQWVFSCAIIFIGLFLAIYGCTLKPVKVKVEEKEGDKEKSTEKSSEKDASKKKTQTNEDKKTHSSASKDAGGKPLLDEGKVTIKLTKDDAEEKAEEKTEEKTEEKKKETKSSEATAGTQRSLPPPVTALTVADDKKGKKKKK